MKLSDFTHIEPVEKGWSDDKKYCVTDKKGIRYLLRISPYEQKERKHYEFEMMLRLAALDIPMCRALDFGECTEGIYSIHTWIDGNDARDVIPMLSPSDAYKHGITAGRILKRIHTLPSPADCESWSTRFSRKIDKKLKFYSECPIKYDNGKAFINHIENNRHLLNDRPQCFHHGDYHIGNFMIDSCGKLIVIDFNRCDHGDPWEEFNRIVWSAQSSPDFARGMTDGYFDGNVPLDFWKLLGLYISVNTLSSLPWAVPFGQKEIDIMMQQADEILSWYDNMTAFIPKWYKS